MMVMKKIAKISVTAFFRLQRKNLRIYFNEEIAYSGNNENCPVTCIINSIRQIYFYFVSVMPI